MRMPGATTAGSGDRRALSILLGACLLALGCAQEPARQVAVGDEIEIGPYAFKILRARTTPNPPPPISTFRSQPGKKGIVVFAYWKALDDLDTFQRMAFIDSFLNNQLSITDSEGERTEAFDAMQEKLMRMQDPGANWRDWVVVFYVPEESRDLTLLVENPEPREGQARFSAVPLGM